MTVFEYIIGIHSIVLGLAIASLLSTFAEQLKYREAKHLYWVHSAWCLTLLFFYRLGLVGILVYVRSVGKHVDIPVSLFIPVLDCDVPVCSISLS